MLDVYRTAAKAYPPACMHCMTARWIVWEPLFGYWFCAVCGEEPVQLEGEEEA